MKAQFEVLTPGTHGFESIGKVTLAPTADGNDEWAVVGDPAVGSIQLFLDRTKAGTDDLFQPGNVLVLTFEVAPVPEAPPSPSTISDAPPAELPPSTSPESPEPAPVVEPSVESGQPSDSTDPGNPTSTTDSAPSSTPEETSPSS